MWAKNHTHDNLDVLNKVSENNGKLAYNGSIVSEGGGTGTGSITLPVSSPPSVTKVDTYIDAEVSSSQGFFYPIVGMYNLKTLSGLTAGTATLEFTPVFADSPTQIDKLTGGNLTSSSSAELHPVSSGAASSFTPATATMTSGTRVTLTSTFSAAQIANGFAFWVLKFTPPSGVTTTRYKVTFENIVFKINSVEIPKSQLIGAISHTVFSTVQNDVKINRTYAQINAVLQSRWAGKTHCIYGDSISASTNGVGPRYPQILPKILGTSYTEDRSASGMAIVNPSNTLQSRMIRHHNFDLITIALGFNDWSFGVPIGTLGNRSDTVYDKTTFYGGYRYCLDTMIKQNPFATIVLLIPIFNGSIDGNNGIGNKIQDYKDAIHALGQFYNIPVFDTQFGINHLNKSVFLYDVNIHAGDLGHWRYADYLGSYLASL